MGKSLFFTVIDMEKVYWQVELDPKDREITAFKANGRLYEWRRAAMGLKSSGVTFTRLMNIVLSGLEGEICLAYIDDLIIYGNSFRQHNERLEQVLQRLQKYKLKINPLKCNILARECLFLGHKISRAGIEVDENKTKAISNYPVPKSQRDIKMFLGSVNYFRKFIPDLAAIARPLNMLLRKDTKFNFNEKCMEAFEALKQKLITPPVLIHPDFEKEFIIRTDASQFASGAVLSQGQLNEDLPIAFMSKTFNKHEVRYSTVEKELLAIMHAVRNYRPYIYLRKFLLVTDNKALVWIMNQKNPASRLFRWKLELLEYDFDIIYRSGASNKVADALSRIDYTKELKESMRDKIDNEKSVNITTRSKANASREPEDQPPNLKHFVSDAKIIEEDILFTPTSIIKSRTICKIFVLTNITAYPFRLIENEITSNSQQGELFEVSERSWAVFNPTDWDIDKHKELWLKIKETVTKNEQHKVYVFIGRAQFNLFDTVRTAILYCFHNSKIDIHIISNQIIYIEDARDKQTIIKNHHDNIFGGHLGIKSTIDNVKQQYYWENMGDQIRKYIGNCLTCKKCKITTHTKMPMHITEVADRGFSKISVDCLGPYEASNLGMRYAVSFQCDLTKFSSAVPTVDITANTVAKVLVEEVIFLHGIPRVILTDLGSNFTSEVFENCCKILRITHKLATVTHAQSVGVERFHRYLGDFIRAYTNKKRDDWCQMLRFASFVYNSRINSTTKYSPHYLLYGFQTEIPTGLKSNPAPIYNWDNYALIMQNRLKTAHEVAKENIRERKEINKRQYDKNANAVEFKIGDKVLIFDDNKKHKFAARYLGPFEVIDIPSQENCTIMYKGRNRTLHRNKLKLV